MEVEEDHMEVQEEALHARGGAFELGLWPNWCSPFGFS